MQGNEFRSSDTQDQYLELADDNAAMEDEEFSGGERSNLIRPLELENLRTSEMSND